MPLLSSLIRRRINSLTLLATFTSNQPLLRFLFTGVAGATQRLTHWEQLDYGRQYTPTRKFLAIVPIVLFFLTSFFSRYEDQHLLINVTSLALVMVGFLVVVEIRSRLGRKFCLATLFYSLLLCYLCLHCT